MGVKYQVNENFFDKWGTEMAYVLGYIYADGSLEDASYLRGKYLKITSTDKEMIEKVKFLLGSVHKVVEVLPLPYTNRKVRYIIRIGSHKLYNALTQHGLYPNKSLTMDFPSVPELYVHDFVRGYFDGDGCVYLERARGKTRDMITKRMSIIFTSGSKEFLVKLESILKKRAGLSNKSIYNSHRSFQLRYSTDDSIKLFKFLYKDANNLFLKRKVGVVGKYFKLQPSRIDNDVRELFNYLTGPVAKE